MHWEQHPLQAAGKKAAELPATAQQPQAAEEEVSHGAKHRSPSPKMDPRLPVPALAPHKVAVHPFRAWNLISPGRQNGARKTEPPQDVWCAPREASRGLQVHFEQAEIPPASYCEPMEQVQVHAGRAGTFRKRPSRAREDSKRCEPEVQRTV